MPPDPGSFKSRPITPKLYQKNKDVGRGKRDVGRWNQKKYNLNDNNWEDILSTGRAGHFPLDVAILDVGALVKKLFAGAYSDGVYPQMHSVD